MKKIIILAMLSLLLAACAVDPRKAAVAYETVSRADQAAADRELQREIAVDDHQIDMADAAAAAQERQAAQQRVIRNFGNALIVLAWVTSLGVAAGAAAASIGAGRAVARKAEVQANLIRLDPQTRQFPLLIQYAGKGRYSLVNPNTGSVALLDTRQDEHRQMIQACGAVQLAGVIAHEAARSKDPAGVATVMPILTEMTAERK